MSGAAVLDQCRVAGISVWIEGERLRFKAAAPLADTLLADLRANKSELIALLSAPANDAITREIDPDALTDWLRSESLCLVLRDGALIFTGQDGQGTGQPSAALRYHVEAHRVAILELLTPLEA